MTSQGATAYAQRNEKQTIYLDSMRGAIGGSFRLFFTDAFGQTWPTSEIHVSELLKGGEGGVSSASVDATTKSVVTFFPALPAGDLAIGDFLMIADERKEILTVYPEPLSYRPSKSGGVIDSVKLRTDLQAVSSSVPAFRMGPARGVRKALRTIPQGIVTDVATSTLNDGTLIGYVDRGKGERAGERENGAPAPFPLAYLAHSSMHCVYSSMIRVKQQPLTISLRLLSCLLFCILF